MSALVDSPAFGHGCPGGVLVAGAGVGMPAGNLPAAGHRGGRGARPTVREARRQDVVDEARGVGRGHGRILVTMEDDQRQRLRRGPGRAWRALPHRRQRRGQVTGGGVGQPGVDADGGVQIGVDRGHHRGHRASGGKTGHVHPVGIYAVAVHDLGGDPGDQRRLAGVAPLMTGGKPVPVPARVRRAVLFGVGDQEGLTLGEVVHAGSGGEGGCILGAAVQHHDQGQGGAGVAGWDIEPVGAGTGSVGVGEGVKPARWSLGGRGADRCARAGPVALRPGKARRRRIQPEGTRLSGIPSSAGGGRTGGRGSMPPVSSSAASGHPACAVSPPGWPGSAESARLPRRGALGGSGGWPQPSPPSGVHP